MKPAAFRYLKAVTVEEAIASLTQHPNAKIVAGGQSLVPLMNFRLTRPEVLVDINGLHNHRGIRKNGAMLTIGALVRHQQLATDLDVVGQVPVLAVAARHIGHWAVRNRGTLGGSLAHADPAAELPAALIALGASFVIMGPDGEKHVAAADFFQGFFTTALEPDEIIVSVDIPITRRAFGFSEVVRRPGDFALVGAYVEQDGDKGAVTWFGLDAAPERRVVDAWPHNPAERRARLEQLARDIPIDASEEYKLSIAVTVAERAYQQAKEEQ